MDNLDLRVRILNALEARTELAGIRQEVAGLGDTAEAASVKSGRGFSTFSSGLKGMLGIMGISGVALGLKDLVSSGVKLENQQVQLRAALQAAGVTGTQAFNSINASMKNLSTRGGFNWTEQLQGMTAFIRQTNNVTEAQQAMRAAVELARGRSIDLATAEHAVSAAIGGNVWSIKQYVAGIVPANKAVTALNQQEQRWRLQLEMRKKLMGGTPLAQQWYQQQVIGMEQYFAAQKRIAQRTDLQVGAQEILNKVTAAYPNALQKYDQTTAGKLSNLANQFKIMVSSAGKGLLGPLRFVVGVLSEILSGLNHIRPVLVAISGIMTTLFMMWAGQKMVAGVRAMWTDLKLVDRAANAAAFFMRLMGVESTITRSEMKKLTELWALLNDEEKAAVANTERFQVMMDATRISAGEVVAEIAVMLAPLAAALALGASIGFGIAELVWHWKDVEHAFSVAFHAMGVGVKWFKNLMHHVAQDVTNAFVAAFHWILQAARNTWNFIKRDSPLGALPMLLHGNFGGALHAATFGLAHTGGRVEPHYFAVGGPVGTDTIPGWLSPGEYVLNRALTNQIGAGTLDYWSAAGFPGGGGMQTFNIVPGQVNLSIDGRRVAQAVVRYTIERAARGPSSLIGGSLVTGAGGASNPAGNE